FYFPVLDENSQVLRPRTAGNSDVQLAVDRLWLVQPHSLESLSLCLEKDVFALGSLRGAPHPCVSLRRPRSASTFDFRDPRLSTLSSGSTPRDNNFTAATTITNESLGVAGVKGGTKLPSDLGKNVKTLPALRDLILGLDVAGNGRQLHLKPEYVAAMKQPNVVHTRPTQDWLERGKMIITSTGPHVITWSIRRVMNGHYDYQIK
ncbi:hypothetical protein BG003_011971, partial [Podila horticola]